MNKIDLYHFNFLKKEIERVFLENNKVSTPIKEWKGNDIIEFQEDLFEKVKEKVSEKWFYTYLKNDAKSLPRIDILNFLSKYAGYKNWHTFKDAHKKESIVKKSKSFKTIYGLGFLLLLMLSFYFLKNKNEFHFCFIDDDKNEIIQSILDIKIIKERETPIYLKTDSLGCFTYKTKGKSIKFVVQSPYYKTDTIIRFINSNSNNQINLQTDDYALMLQYYANGNIEDWKQRRQQLNNLFENNAQIYQLFNNSIAIELYSKDDFIRKLTTPTSSLKNIKILDKTFKNGKIVKLKFMVK